MSTSCFAARLVASAVVILAAACAAFAQDTRAPEPADDAVVDSIPFDPSSAEVCIAIDLAKEGAMPFLLDLDTGASFSVVSPRKARELGVSIRRTKNTPYRRATRLGRDLQFYVDTDSSDTAAKTFEYGVIGANFLEQYVVELDFRNRRVRFLDPKKFTVPKSVAAEGEAIVPLEFTSGRPIVPVVHGGRETSALLDTGYAGSLVLSGAAAKTLALDTSRLRPAGQLTGVIGSTDALMAAYDDVAIAGFALPGMPVMVAPRGLYNMGSNTDSLVGCGWLRRFTARIDYPRARMWLRREVEPGTPIRWREWGG